MSVISDEVKKSNESPFMANLSRLIIFHKNDLIRNAINLFMLKKYEEAQDYLLNSYPEYSLSEDTNALLLMGHIQIKLSQLDSALEYFRQGLKMSKRDDFFIYDSLGMIYFFKKEYDMSLKYINEAFSFSENNYYYQYHSGLYYEAILKNRLEGKISFDDIQQLEVKDIKDKIKEYYSRAIEIDPNAYNPLINIGTLYASDKDFNQAEKFFKKAILINETDWRINLNMAFIYIRDKSYGIALEFLEKVVKSLGDTKDLNILIPYIICLYKERSWEKLEKYCKKVLKLDKKNKKALTYLIEALKQENKFEQLLNLFEKIKEKMKKIKSSSQKKSVKFSKCYEKIKKIIKQHLKEVEEIVRSMDEDVKRKEIEAQNFKEFSQIAKLDTDNISSFGFNVDEIKNLLVVHKLNPNSVDAIYHLGLIHYKVENYVQSEELFSKVRSLDPQYQKSTVSACLGDIYLLVKKKPKEALQYFLETLETEKENELIQVKIGVCYELMEQNDKALEYYKKGYELNKEFPASIFHIGAIYDKKGSDEALKWFEMAYEKEKENVEYLRKYGDSLVRNKDKDKIEKGISILEKGLEFFMGNVDIMSSLAIGYEKQGKLKEAIQLLELANNKETFFNNKTKVFQLACYYEKAKNFTKAVEQFKRVLSLEKNNTEALLHIGFIYKSCKEYVKSYKCFNKIISNEPNNAHAYYGLGKLFQLMNNRDNEAIEQYNKCIKIEPNYYNAKIQLGVLFLKTKNYDKSYEILKSIYEKEKNNPLLLTCLGNIYIEKKDYHLAEKYLIESLKIEKKNIAANAALADAYFAMGKIDEAIPKYIAAIKLGGTLPEIYLNLGHCYYIKDKFEQSINNYILALKIVKNTRHDYYYYLGNALVAGKRYKDAIKAYQAAIKLKNNKLLYYFVLGRTCYLDNQYKLGIKHLEDLMEISKRLKNPKLENFNDKDILFLLFKCYSSLPSIDKAKCKNLVSELMKDDNKNIKYINCLATLYEKTNQTFEAIQQYKKILKIDPFNSEAKRDLKRLEDMEK